MDRRFTIPEPENKLKKDFSKFFFGLGIFFMVVFMGCVGYWMYEVYTIHNTSATSAPNYYIIMEAAAHSQVAFQASLLAFLLGLTFLRLAKIL